MALRKVIHVADIANLTEKAILNNVIKGTNYRGSKLKWPKSDIPKEWWKIWSTYVRSYIVPSINTHPLRPIVQDSHQTYYPWKIYKNEILMNEKKEAFEKMKTRTRKQSYERTNKISTGIGKIVDVYETGEGWRIVSGPIEETFLEEEMKQINKIKTQRLSSNYPPESFQSPYS